METQCALIANYQFKENYAYWDWDQNSGEPCPQRWKNKGGDEEILAEDLSVATVQEIIAEHGSIEAWARPRITMEDRTSDAARWYYLGTDIVYLGDQLLERAKAVIEENGWDITGPNDYIPLGIYGEMTDYEAKWCLKQIHGNKNV